MNKWSENERVLHFRESMSTKKLRFNFLTTILEASYKKSSWDEIVIAVVATLINNRRSKDSLLFSSHQDEEDVSVGSKVVESVFEGKYFDETSRNTDGEKEFLDDLEILILCYPVQRSAKIFILKLSSIGIKTFIYKYLSYILII